VAALTSERGQRRWRGRVLGVGQRSDGGGGRKSNWEGFFARGVLQSEDGGGEGNRGAAASGGGRGVTSRGDRGNQAARLVRTVGWCRVTDERGPTGSRNGPAERGEWRVGRPGKKRSGPSPDEQ
jgi:hypothetical protein